MATTITEALAELKTTAKKLEKKVKFVTEHTMRDARAKDPLEKDGGSAQMIAREMQAIDDLFERIVLIRDRIQEVNHKTVATVNGKSRTISQWLHWKRDVSDQRRRLLAGLAGGIANGRKRALQDGKKLASSETDDTNTIIVHLSEVELQAAVEDLEQTIGELDGKLSLVNATTTIDI